VQLLFIIDKCLFNLVPGSSSSDLGRDLVEKRARFYVEDAFAITLNG